MSSEKAKVKSILVVAITRMGDMLQASPTLVGLKREYPEARITVCIEKQFRAICEGIPGIDEVYELDLALVCRCLAREREGVVEAFEYVSERVEELKLRKFDFCLNMSSSAYTAILLKMLEIPDCRGWVSDEEGHRIISSPWAMLFSAFVYHSNRDYNSMNLVDVFRSACGVTQHPKHLVYNTTEEARSFARDFVKQNGGDSKGPLICIQAGASQEKRQWSPARFAYLTELLVRDQDAHVMFVGSKSELKIIDSIVSQAHTRLPENKHANITVAAGITDFNQLAALLENAKVLITGDTGPMHMSVAVGTPVVALFLASALCFETGPYSEGNFVIQPQVSCNPCNPNYPCARPDCHDQIRPELVAYLTKLRAETTTKSLDNVRIDERVADPSEVAVYVTNFDRDNFLDFHQVNGIAPRHGRPGEYFRSAREAYRTLWKEEFQAARERFDLQGQRPSVNLPEIVSNGLGEAIALTTEGAKLLAQLSALIRDKQSPPKLLGEVSQALEQIDKNIEEVGLGFPILGALTRIFVMEKENMRGDDPLKLASQMNDIYQKLAHRAEKFGQLFGYYSTEGRS